MSNNDDDDDDGDDVDVSYWRSKHGVGHSLLRQQGGGVNAQRRKELNTFAGHLAQANCDHASAAFRTRPMAWWRHFQSTGCITHSGCFRARRWEEQLESMGKRKVYLLMRMLAGCIERKLETIGVTIVQLSYTA